MSNENLPEGWKKGSMDGSEPGGGTRRPILLAGEREVDPSLYVTKDHNEGQDNDISFTFKQMQIKNNIQRAIQ